LFIEKNLKKHGYELQNAYLKPYTSLFFDKLQISKKSEKEQCELLKNPIAQYYNSRNRSLKKCMVELLKIYASCLFPSSFGGRALSLLYRQNQYF